MDKEEKEVIKRLRYSRQELRKYELHLKILPYMILKRAGLIKGQRDE
uniref:Uncharacterized protein n=1 Tax=viral metagenome TaxID=1070528 RepID=A0A6H1ZFI5_9ZZZZ